MYRLLFVGPQEFHLFQINLWSCLICSFFDLISISATGERYNSSVHSSLLFALLSYFLCLCLFSMKSYLPNIFTNNFVLFEYSTCLCLNDTMVFSVARMEVLTTVGVDVTLIDFANSSWFSRSWIMQCYGDSVTIGLLFWKYFIFISCSVFLLPLFGLVVVVPPEYPKCWGIFFWFLDIYFEVDFQNI